MGVKQVLWGEGDRAAANRPGPAMRKPANYIFVLVGFMGCGKSTVGRALAERLGVPFRDLDHLIATAAQATVSELFARQGEEAFRTLERTTLETALDELAGGGVLATGGGTFVDPESRRRLVRPEVVTVWLDAPIEFILRRVPRDGSRPLFGDEASVSALYAARREAYRAANLRIEVGDTSPEATAEQLLRALRDGPLAQADA